MNTAFRYSALTLVVAMLALFVLPTRVHAADSLPVCKDESTAIISNIYAGALGRNPDEAGLAYWKQIAHVHDIKIVMHSILNSSEYQSNMTEVSQWYARILDRIPSETESSYWINVNRVDALYGIATSPETLGCLIQVVQYDGTPIPSGWVDLGHGVYMPSYMTRVRGCESGGGPNNPGNYSARNNSSTASGGWQFIQSTARAMAELAGRPDLIAYGDNVAGSWSPRDQDIIALTLLKYVNFDPGHTWAWKASKHCWG